jgi:hypothetical protein
MATRTAKKPPAKAPVSTTLPSILSQAPPGLGSTTGPGSPTSVGAAQNPTPAQYGITDTSTDNVSGLPVTFYLPHSKPITHLVPGATYSGGKTETTYVGAVAAISHMSQSQVEELQRNMIDSGYLAETTALTGNPTGSTLTAWKKLVLDAANSGTPVDTLLQAGGAAPAIVTAQKAAQSALQTAQTNYADIKTGTASLTDPNSITQALDAAYASIGVGQPPPNLVQAFITSFQGQQEQAAASPLEQLKTQEGQAISGLEGAQTKLQQGNINGGTSAINGVEGAPGPIDVGTKAPPNLDADSMAQAKASNPSQYYATQSSYLYGLLLNSIRGTAPQQTAPTAPSSTAPGGANLGTPIVGA